MTVETRTAADSRRGRSPERRAGSAGAAVPAFRVCLLTEGFPPEMKGGMFINNHRLAAGLIRRGVEVTVVTRQMVPGLPARDVVDGVPVVRLGPVGPLTGLGWRAVPPLLRFLAGLTLWLLRRGRRYDAAITAGFKTLLLPALAARAGGGPRLIVRSEAPMEFREAISRASVDRIRPRALGRLLLAVAGAQRGLLRRADACVAISPEIAALFRDAGVAPGRVLPIPNGVDTDRFRPADPVEVPGLRAELGLPRDRPVLLYTGRLARTKGLLTLAEAFARLAERAPLPLLVLLGTGEGSVDDCEAELRRLAAELPLAGSLALRGWAANPVPWLQAADLFVFPSEYEGFGLSLVEAMAAGLPVVATPVGAAPEVVRDGANGWLVPVGDAERLSGGLAAALAARDVWRSMGSAGRAAVVDRFGMEGVLDRYVDLLVHLTRKDRAGAIAE